MTRGVEPALLDRRADDVAPVAARDDVAALVADHAAQQRRRRVVRRVAQAQELALHGADGNARGVGQARGARRTTGPRRRRRRAAARRSPSVELEPGGAAVADDDAGATAVCGRSSTPARSAASASAAPTSRGSTAWSPGTSTAARSAGASAGSSARACEGSSGSRLEPEPLAQRELAVQRGRLVRVAGDEQRAAGAVADVDAAHVRELGGERRPAPRALQPERDERGLLRVRLADGREHPGGDGRRGAGERPAVHEHDAQPARPRAPGDDEAADAAADDGDVEGGVLGGWQNDLLASPA